MSENPSDSGASKDRFRSTSKFLSLILRHSPQTIGLSLDNEGWVDIDELISAMNLAGKRIDRDFLEQLVKENDKQRFIIDDQRSRIRANQGHSVEIELGLQPAEPPETLFHGTVEKFIKSIRQRGLVPGTRQHVHLSTDRVTAAAVGQRRGKPVILVVGSGHMKAAGFEFFQSANGVWLTKFVPVKFIEFPT